MFDSWQTLFFRFVVAAIVLATPAAANPTHLPDKAQEELNRIEPLLKDGMFRNGRVSTISAKSDASDDLLIQAAVEQLNFRPAPVKVWKTLRKELLQTGDILGSRYLVAVASSDQGDKIVVIDKARLRDGGYWARMYNCDAVFSSPQEGGTPLIR